MRKILTGAAILALSTSLLTGCSGMIEAIEKSANYSDVEKIDYNLYRIPAHVRISISNCSCANSYISVLKTSA